MHPILIKLSFTQGGRTTALHAAVQIGAHNIIKDLVKKHKADINVFDEVSAQTPFRAASKNTQR
jgi:hypothetical protein